MCGSSGESSAISESNRKSDPVLGARIPRKNPRFLKKKQNKNPFTEDYALMLALFTKFNHFFLVQRKSSANLVFSIYVEHLELVTHFQWMVSYRT